MKKSKKNELVCPFCGRPVEHTAKSTKKCVNGVWEDIEEQHTFKCPKCYTGEFEMSSVEEFQEYCAWRDKLVNHFIIVVDEECYPTIAIGVVFKGEGAHDQHHNFHPHIFLPGHRMPRPRHMDKVFRPNQRQDAIALYQKLIKEYLDSREEAYAEKLKDFFEPEWEIEERYPKLWNNGMKLLRQQDMIKMDELFAKFLRFLHEYDVLAKEYPDEKDQIKHLSAYFSWLYVKGEEYSRHRCTTEQDEKLEKKLLAAFKKTHK